MGKIEILPYHAASDVVLFDGKPTNTIDPFEDRRLSLLARMIARIHHGEFVLPKGSIWLVARDADDPETPLGYVEIVEEANRKCSFGHILITGGKDVADMLFAHAQGAVFHIGKDIDDLHPDHGWYAGKQVSASRA